MLSTKICTFNIEEPVFAQLKSKVSTIYDGSIGNRIKIPNLSREDVHYCLLNLDFPENFHEYEIFVINLLRDTPIDYKIEDHQRELITGSSVMVLQSSFPETLFDPKPLCLNLLRNKINSLCKQSLFIVFSESDYEIEYQPVIISDSFPKKGQKESYSVYNFFDFPLLKEGKSGVETQVIESVNFELKKILEKHNEDASYYQTFFHPDVWDKTKRENINDPNFFPIMLNSQDEIISYAHSYDNLTLFVFPQFKKKDEFLDEFLFEFAPNIVPKLFPEIIKNQWTKDEEYYLPNHSNLLKEKEEETIRFTKEIENIESKITANTNKYFFLHEMLLATGDDLVKSVITFLKWLGFKNPVDFDKDKKGVLEEDIQIDTNKGLIIIEVKGIGGTSKDSDCSQISKIKHRRAKERESFDVYAHYLVNHQRHLPPMERENPPFTVNQISDSSNEERGLMSTWQLFNLYYFVLNGIVTKEEAKEKFYEFGLIDFKPNCQLLGKVGEIFQNGYVPILNLKDVKISVGNTLLVEKNNQLKSVKIISLHVNDISVEEAINTEVGIKLNQKIAIKSLLYLKL